MATITRTSAARAHANGIELCWDRPPETWLARDADSHLTFASRQLDLEGLLREGLEEGEAPPSPERFTGPR